MAFTGSYRDRRRLDLRNDRLRFLDNNYRLRLRFLNLYRFRSWCRRDVDDHRRGIFVF
jgi:hypothetical protein